MVEKQNWLEALKEELRELPKEDYEDIIDNYREQISQMLAEGSTEEEILKRLGSPQEIADEAKQALGYEKNNQFNQEDDINKSKKTFDSKGRNEKSGLNQLLYVALFVVFALIALSVGSAALGFVIAGMVIFFVSFFTIQITWSLFLFLMSIGLLLFNAGIGMFYALYYVGRYLIRQFK